MAAPREVPWSTAEKNYMLAEIIKAYYPNPNVLFGVINQLGLSVLRWDDIALPPGRSLTSCRNAFEELRRNHGAPMMHSSYGPQTPSPMSAHLPVNLKRSYPYEGSFPAGREIRPKPSSAGNGYGQTTTMDNPPKKKRGRPTKAEAQAKAEAQTPGGAPTPHSEVTGPPSAGSTGPQLVETQIPVVQAPLEPLRPTLPPATRMPISDILTPGPPFSADQPSSSSGKRKRARSTRSEAEHPPGPGEEQMGRAGEYASPYGRLELGSHDSPATAAVLRHRDEPESAFRPPAIQEYGAQAPPTSEPEPETK